MGARQAQRRDFDEFVAARSGRLLVTAVLLTGDRAQAEQLLRESLVRCWFGWRRLDARPEVDVRHDLVRAWAGHRPHRRQHAALVLRCHDGFDREEAAEVLECSPATVDHLLQRALAGRTTEEAAAELAGQAAATGPDDPRVRVRELTGVVEVAASRRRVLVTTGVAVAAVVTVAGFAVVPAVLPDPAPVTRLSPTLPLVVRPPRLAGWEMPYTLISGGTLFRYHVGQETVGGLGLLRVAVGSRPTPTLLGWVTPPGAPGEVVVSVDGVVVRRSPAGAFQYGVRLAPNRPHLVVVRMTRPRPDLRIGAALYTPHASFVASG